MVNYPFVPRSTAYLEPGHFWSIPLVTGRFACGRVIQLKVEQGQRDRRSFLAGLMAWAGDEAPTYETIAGAHIIEQGQVHVKTIKENDGVVLGHRALELDGIEPLMCVMPLNSRQWGVYKGFDFVRRATAKERRHLPGLSSWGYEVIKIIAEMHFGDLPKYEALKAEHSSH